MYINSDRGTIVNECDSLSDKVTPSNVLVCVYHNKLLTVTHSFTCRAGGRGFTELARHMWGREAADFMWSALMRFAKPMACNEMHWPVIRRCPS